MAERSILHFSSQLQTDFSNREDAKKRVSEVLKRVDQLIRKGDLELAQGEIFKAKEIDPRNVYTLALEERISNLKLELERIEKTKHGEENSENKMDHKLPGIKPMAMRNAPYPPKAANSTAAPPPEKTVKGYDTDAKKNNQPQHDAIHSRNIELETYHKALMDAWIDGSLTESEKRQISELKALLEITDAEHEHIEKNVRWQCYRNAVIQILSINPNAALNSKSYYELRSIYQISEEEHRQIYSQILNTTQHKQRDKILVVDDDTRLLDLLQTSLEDNGFEVIALSTSDEAFALLRKFTPDLILCDINLETSAMGGFTFYERIQEYKHVQNVPFIFLTGLTDELIVRTGKELGVDDFLMKPISERMLIAALRGKLKRFKQLKKNKHVSMASITRTI